MTVKFGYGNGTYLAVVSPVGRRDLEARAEDIQADPKLWTGRQKKTALALRLGDDLLKKPRYVRKNAAERRMQAKLHMRKLRIQRELEESEVEV